MLWFVVGLFCVLLVIGALVSDNPLRFAIWGAIVLGAIAFIGFVLLFGWLVVRGAFQN